MSKFLRLTFLFYYIITIISCSHFPEDNDKLKIVCTTTQIRDLLENIGKDKIHVKALMGAGVDPHLYKATEGDVQKIFESDIVFYNGLHLEGKLESVFEKMGVYKNKTLGLGNYLPENKRIASSDFGGNYDPHVWFDVDNFILFAEVALKTLQELDPTNAAFYSENYLKYINELEELKKYIKEKIHELPVEKRVLVTAHDAFSYFGKAFGFQVIGLQGISTQTEAGVKDIKKLTDFIIENNISAIFIESSVPERTASALIASVRAKGGEVSLGGTLYSDALGSKGTEEGTYIGMYKYNINTIVNALKEE